MLIIELHYVKTICISMTTGEAAPHDDDHGGRRGD